MKTLDEFFDESGENIRAVAEEEKKELYGYELPVDWNVVELGKIFREVNKRDRKIRIEDDKDYKLILTRLYAKGVELKEIKSGKEIKADYMYIVKEGDFIFSKINIKKGAFGFIPPELSGAVVSSEHPILKINESSALRDYIFYYLSQPRLWDEFRRQSKGFADKSRTKVPEFLSVKIPLPPLEEQKKIVYVLKTIQRAIEQQDKIIETTKELKKSLMHRLFTKGLDASQPTKQTEIGEVPEHWELIKFNKIITDSKYGLSIRGNKEKKGYPMIRMNNLIDGGLYLDDLQYVEIDTDTFKKFKLEKGDILFNRTNSIDLVGKTTVFDVDGDYVYASYLIRLKLNTSQAFPYFVNYYLNWDITQVRLKSIASKGVSQANISATRLKEFLMVLPPLEEQKQIAQILQTVDRKIEIAKKKKEALQNFFKTMLHKLMTAQIRVEELEVSPEKLGTLSMT